MTNTKLYSYHITVNVFAADYSNLKIIYKKEIKQKYQQFKKHPFKSEIAKSK